MIDFRYHLVSIVAIFLALGLGIVLGSTALQGPVLSGLERTSSFQKTRIDQLYASNQQLHRQLSGNAKFTQGIEPQLLHGLLAGQRIVLVEAPGAQGDALDGAITALRQAGATVTGQVLLQAKFFDTSSSTKETLGQLAQALAPGGLTLNSAATGQGQASQVLASAILTTGAAGEPPAGQRDASGAAILDGFAAEGFLTVSGHPTARATLAVVMIPASAPSASDSDARSQALVTLAQQLRLNGQGAVVAGTAGGSGPGSAIDIMRGTGRGGQLSSVDNTGTVEGQIVLVMALAEQLHGGSGSYGTAPTASSPLPTPVPTPVPTSPAPSPGKTGSKQAKGAKS